MYNLLYSIVIGSVAGTALAVGTDFGLVAAVFPGVLAASVAYFLLARRTWKKLEQIFETVQKEVTSRKLDKAVQTLQGGFALAPWQFMVAAQLHSNIGILLYVQDEIDAALPHLEKSFTRNWIARGMLGAARYRKRDLAGMKKVLEEAVGANKKEGVLWSLYAWILEKEGNHEEAIRVLGRGVSKNSKDEKLKASLQALQNGKKLKLGKVYGEQWFQFMLERPPPVFAPQGGRRALYRG